MRRTNYANVGFTLATKRQGRLYVTSLNKHDITTKEEHNNINITTQGKQMIFSLHAIISKF